MEQRVQTAMLCNFLARMENPETNRTLEWMLEKARQLSL